MTRFVKVLSKAVMKSLGAFGLQILSQFILISKTQFKACFKNTVEVFYGVNKGPPPLTCEQI